MNKKKLLLLTAFISGIIPLTTTPVILNSINFFNKPSFAEKDFEHNWNKFLKLHQKLNHEKDQLKTKIEEISNAFDDLKLKIILEIQRLNEKIEKLNEKIEKLKIINEKLESKIKNYQSVDSVKKAFENNNQFTTSLTNLSIEKFQKMLNQKVSNDNLGINFNQINEIKTNDVIIYLYILNIYEHNGSLMLKAEIHKNDIETNAIIYVNGFISKNDFENDLLRKKIIPYLQTFNNQKNAFDLESKLHKTNTWNDWWKIINNKLLAQFPELKTLIEKLHWKIENQHKELPKDSQIGFETSVEIFLSLTREFKPENIVKVYFENFKKDNEVLQQLITEIKTFFNVNPNKNSGVKIRENSESSKLTAIQYKKKLKGFIDNNLPKAIREEYKKGGIRDKNENQDLHINNNLDKPENQKFDNNKNIDYINNTHLELPATWLWELTGFNISKYNINVKVFFSSFNDEEKDLKQGRIKWNVYLNVENFNENDRWFPISTYGFKH